MGEELDSRARLISRRGFGFHYAEESPPSSCSPVLGPVTCRLPYELSPAWGSPDVDAAMGVRHVQRRMPTRGAVPTHSSGHLSDTSSPAVEGPDWVDEFAPEPESWHRGDGVQQTLPTP
jgi:hypothetical protein